MHIWSGGAAHDRASACVVIAAAALLATSFGTAYAIPAFFPILIKKLAIPSGHFTALFSATGALYFSLGLVIGPVADRNGARRIAMLGQLVLASGLVLISLARSETTFDIAYLLGVGVGVGVGLCFVPAKGAVQAVCWRSPALAGGLAASGIGVGTLVRAAARPRHDRSFRLARRAGCHKRARYLRHVCRTAPAANGKAQRSSRGDRVRSPAAARQVP